MVISMKKILLAISGIYLAMNLGGCATIISGDSEDISISTSPNLDAVCEAKNSRGVWTVPSAPGNVLVKRSSSNLVINCKTKDGYKGTRVINSGIKGAAAGNLLIGGVIGGGIDAATGAAFDYPSDIVVPMRKG